LGGWDFSGSQNHFINSSSSFMQIKSNEHSFLEWTGYFGKENGLSESIFRVWQTFFEEYIYHWGYLDVNSVPSSQTNIFSLLNCNYHFFAIFYFSNNKFIVYYHKFEIIFIIFIVKNERKFCYFTLSEQIESKITFI
jgi:hypothetical protein